MGQSLAAKVYKTEEAVDCVPLKFKILKFLCLNINNLPDIKASFSGAKSLKAIWCKTQ